MSRLDYWEEQAAVVGEVLHEDGVDSRARAVVALNKRIGWIRRSGSAPVRWRWSAAGKRSS